MLEERIKQRIESLRLVLLNQMPRLTAREPGARTPLPIEAVENAREATGTRGKCLLIEKDVGNYISVKALQDAAGVLLKTPRDPSLVFLDLETTGLSSTPLFLAGTLFSRDGSVQVRQLLARDYSEESALIGMLDRLLADFDICVTFNGKAFDIPYIKERAKYHKIDLESSPEQFDLLHHARRRWKHRLPNCRLVTLEWHILGRSRMGDVPGWEVPCIYHEYVHTRDARKIKDVLRHNLVDVLSMAELFVSLAEAGTC